MKLWKVQKFFGDVVYDLRQRGLLPVAVALLVAMVALPIVITRGGGSSTPAPSSPEVEPAANLAPENQKAVLAYNPGLRNYKDRLKKLPAKDPFTQLFVPTDEPEAAATDAGSSAGATDIPSTDTGGGTSFPDLGDSTDSTSTGGGGGGGSGKSTVRYFYSEAEVLAGDAALPLQRFKKLSSFTPLPSQFAAVAIFAGASLDAKQAFFIISKDVSQVTGEGVCAPSPTDCALLTLRAGQTESLLYDVDGKTYTIRVAKIRRVFTKKPPKQ
jgi:hypothetical protein